MRNQHNYNTRESKERMMFKITQNTTSYRLNSKYYRAANDQNDLLKINRQESDDYFPSKLTFTKTLKAYLLNKYIYMKRQASHYSIIVLIQDGNRNRLKTPLFPLYLL